jgi:hypothetical protein
MKMEFGEAIVSLAFIISMMIIAVVWITSPRQVRQRSSPEDRSEIENLKKRMGEMENRILTLQDLVIGGNYDMKRKLEQAEAAHLHASTPPSPETQRKLLEG